MAEIGNVTVRVDAVITDEQYHEAISAVSAANEYIAALEAENAKLRELMYERAHVYAIQNMTEDELRVTTTNVMKENAELRKLVRDVYVLHWSGLDCTECPWIDECDTDGGCPWLGIMRDHMRELGAEVD